MSVFLLQFLCVVILRHFTYIVFLRGTLAEEHKFELHTTIKLKASRFLPMINVDAFGNWCPEKFGDIQYCTNDRLLARLMAQKLVSSPIQPCRRFPRRAIDCVDTLYGKQTFPVTP